MTRAIGRAEVESKLGESALVGRAKDGDLIAYEELVRRHQFDALRVAAAIVGIADAEDAVQEAFVRAFRGLPGYDTTRELRPWLMTIVANTARNLRRSSFRWHRSRVAGGLRQIRDDAATPSAEEESLSQSTAEVAAALDELPRGQREVITCRYLLELSEEETARALGIPRGTVKSRLARGLAGLEQRIERSAP